MPTVHALPFGNASTSTPLSFRRGGGWLPGPEADGPLPCESVFSAASALALPAYIKNENNTERRISIVLPKDGVHTCKAFRLVSLSSAPVVYAPQFKKGHLLSFYECPYVI